MRLHFDDELVSQGKDPFKAGQRFEWLEREKEVGEAVTPGQYAVHNLAIKTVAEALFSRPKGEVSSNSSSSWKKSSKKHVRAQVHVMMAIESPWRCPINTAEFVELG